MSSQTVLGCAASWPTPEYTPVVHAEHDWYSPKAGRMVHCYGVDDTPENIRAAEREQLARDLADLDYTERQDVIARAETIARDHYALTGD